MVWSFPVGRFAGTAIRVHVTFLLLLAWIWIDSYFTNGLAVASQTLVFVVSVFGCVVAHEFGHVLVARSFGGGTPDITLYPFGGIARLNTMPQAPWQEFLIAIAGPVVNIAIAAALLLFAGAILNFTELAAVPDERTSFATRLATTNVVLVAFNLIPAFPMDGGRLLRALLATRVDFERATRIAATTGHLIALAFAVVGLFSSPMLIVIAIFIYFAATAEMQATAVRAFSADMPVARAMITEFATLSSRATVADAVETLLRTSQKVIPVVDDTGQLAGSIEIANVLRALHDGESRQQSVADFMNKDTPTLKQTAKLAEAFRLLQENMTSAVAIVDDAARVVGLVTLETLSEMLMLHDASASVFDRFQSDAGAGALLSRAVH
jgi:Zn-dependent protease/CBS domain-containing protein